METILSANWYCADDIARVLEISIEDAQALIRRLAEGGRVPISNYPDPTHPAINGYTLREIAGQRQPRPYMSMTRRRR
jgi:hypothetical protein